jgi:hypothetical protein
MFGLIVQAVASLLLIVIGFVVDARGAAYVFSTQILPLLVGVLLAFFTLAQFMGWPV